MIKPSGRIAAVYLGLVSLLLVTGCNAANTSSPALTNTDIATPRAITGTYTTAPSVLTGVYIATEPCKDDPQGDFIFENVTVTRGILKRDYRASWGIRYEPGESCYLITGRIINKSSKDYWVAFQAYGYDEDGNVVSGTLDTYPIPGIYQSFIAAGDSLDFTLHLNWAADAVKFVLQSEKRTAKISLPFL